MTNNLDDRTILMGARNALEHARALCRCAFMAASSLNDPSENEGLTTVLGAAENKIDEGMALLGKLHKQVRKAEASQ